MKGWKSKMEIILETNKYLIGDKKEKNTYNNLLN